MGRRMRLDVEAFVDEIRFQECVESVLPCSRRVDRSHHAFLPAPALLRLALAYSEIPCETESLVIEALELRQPRPRSTTATGERARAIVGCRGS